MGALPSPSPHPPSPPHQGGGRRQHSPFGSFYLPLLDGEGNEGGGVQALDVNTPPFEGEAE